MEEKGNVLNIRDYINENKEGLKILSNIDSLENKKGECRVIEFKEIELRKQIKSIAKAYYEGRYDIDDEM